MVVSVGEAVGTRSLGAGSSRAPPAARRRVTHFQKAFSVRCGYSRHCPTFTQRKLINRNLFLFVHFKKHIHNYSEIIDQTIPSDSWTRL